MSERAAATAAGTIDVGGDLTVNRMGFGAMRITGQGIWGDPPDHDRAIATLRRVVELGVNFIDTADAYGPDVSENLLAEALHPYPDDLVIATKGGLLRSGPGRWETDGRPEHLREACEGSLRRLKMDQIPLYQFHRPDPKVNFVDSIGALVELKNEGKIRHIGLSNVNEHQLREAQHADPDRLDPEPVQRRRPELGVDARPLRAGADRRSCPWAPLQDTGTDGPVSAAAKAHGVSEHQIVLAWLLAHSPQMLPIPGTGSPDHAEDNIAAASIKLTPDEIPSISHS